MNIVGRPVRVATVGAVIGLLALAGCGSSAKSSSGTSPTTAASPTTSAASAVCQSVNEFKTSLSALTNPSTFTGGKSGAQAALDSVKTSLTNVKSTLKSSDKPKVDALESSITDLQTAVNNLSGLSGLGAVTSAAQNVEQSAQAVLAALKTGCPSS